MKAAKKALRRQLRQTRRALPATERAKAQAACNRALKTFIRRGKNIAVYWAMGGELDLDDWVQAALKRGAISNRAPCASGSRPIRAKPSAPNANAAKAACTSPSFAAKKSVPNGCTKC